MTEPCRAECLSHARRLARFVAEHEPAHECSVVARHGARPAVDEVVDAVGGAMPRRIRRAGCVHHHLLQFALQVTPGDEPQTALVECHTRAVDEQHVAHSHVMQGVATSTTRDDAEVLPLNFDDEGHGVVLRSGIAAREDDARVLPRARRGEAMPLGGAVHGKERGNDDE